MCRSFLIYITKLVKRFRTWTAGEYSEWVRPHWFTGSHCTSNGLYLPLCRYRWRRYDRHTRNDRNILSLAETAESRLVLLLVVIHFIYKKLNGQFIKWRSCGRTIIQDHVEIRQVAQSIRVKVILSSVRVPKLTVRYILTWCYCGGKNCLCCAGWNWRKNDHWRQCGCYMGKVKGSPRIFILETTRYSISWCRRLKNLEDGKTYFGAGRRG